MTKRKFMLNAWEINGRKGEYIVVMERLKNNTYGNPRWKAIIIKKNPDEYGWLYNAVYTFNGHYMDSKDEAKYIVELYEKEIGE